MKGPARLITFAAAVIAGMILALLIVPAWREHRALSAIAGDDPAVRQHGWDRLTATVGDDGGIPAERLIDDISNRLAAAGDEALLHGGLVLRQHDLWGWAHQDRDLLLREIALRCGRAEEPEHAMALELLAACPLDLPADALAPLFDALLDTGSEQIRRAALSAACGFAGRDNAAFIGNLTIPADDVPLNRLRQLALSWARPAVPPDSIDTGAPADMPEALLLHRTVAEPDDASPVLAALEAWTGDDRPAFQYILRFSDDRRAVAALERMAEGGDRSARYALQARARHLDDAQARSVLGNPDQELIAKQMAAWRWDRVPPEQVRALLAADVADEDGGVHAAALLAERRLPREEAVALAEAWIRSFNDDEKRAGALLAALLGEHADLLDRASRIEDIGRVRTIQSLALWAMGRTAGDEDPVALAHRALHARDGDFDGDVAMCMLLAGRSEALGLLTGRPTGDLSRAVRKRAWLIERFAPSWHEAVGRPIGGSIRAIDLHLDRLEALRMLTQRRLRYETDTATYTETVSTSAGASSAEADRPG